MSVVGPLLAALLKEARLFLRYPGQVVAWVVSPILVGAPYLLLTRMLAGPDDVYHTSYILLGVISWYWMTSMLWRTGLFLREEQWRGTLETWWTCPASPYWSMLGNALFNLLSNLVITGYLLLGMWALGFPLHYREGLEWTAVIMVLALPGLYGIGLMVAVISLLVRESNVMIHVLNYLFALLAGVTFPVSYLPNPVERLAGLFPMTRAIEGVRAALLHGNPPDGTNLVILASQGVVCFGLGALAFQATAWRQASTGRFGL